MCFEGFPNLPNWHEETAHVIQEKAKLDKFDNIDENQLGFEKEVLYESGFIKRR